MNVLQISSKFGEPTACKTGLVYNDGKYCVLGAAIMFQRNADPFKTMVGLRFPGIDVASRELGISYTDAETISTLNDSGNFDSAWRELKMALSGQGVDDEE